MSAEKLHSMNEMGMESSSPSHSRTSDAPLVPLELPSADLRPIVVVVVVMPVEIMELTVYGCVITILIRDDDYTCR